MNIQPVKSEGAPTPLKPKAASAKAPEAQAEQEGPVAARETALRELLAQEPALRPEHVERGKALAANPKYPSDELLAKLAEMFVQGGK